MRIIVTWPHSSLITPTHILWYVFWFLLCNQSGKCCKHFHVHFACINSLFFKIHTDSEFFKHSYYYKKVLCISCKSWSRFGNNSVYLSFFTVIKQTVKFRSLFHIRSRQTFVSINLYQLILWVLLCIIGIVFNLINKRIDLISLIGWYTTVSGKPYFLNIFNYLIRC